MRTRLAAAASCAALLTGCGLGSGTPEPRPDDDAVARLTDNAVRVGVAIDIFHDHAMRKDARFFWPQRITPAVLAEAGVTLDETVQVANYTSVEVPDGKKHAERIELAAEDDYWQFCVADRDGNWLTYGTSTGVQASGTSVDPEPCAFTGERSEDAGFDVRALAADFFDESPSFGGNAPGKTWGTHTVATAWVTDRLPDGWATSDVDMRGWTGWQFCLTAPSREWFYVRSGTVEDYGNTGRCHIDRDWRGSN